MATVGVYLRVLAAEAERVRADLDRLPGVSTFELDEPGKLGVVLETEDLDAAHRAILHRLQAVPGVLAAWPVYAHFEDASDAATTGLPFANQAPDDAKEEE